MLWNTLRSVLFRLEPETAHALGIFSLRVLGIVGPLRRSLLRRQRDDERLSVSCLGRSFRNPLGLAAGFDKNGLALRALPALGFGFAEVGTVTPKPQAGNPKPRLFRYPEANSLQNCLGFNNLGADALVRRLEQWRRRPVEVPFPVGVNIGKNRDTPAQEALADYGGLIERFRQLADYLVVNLSSPNTPGLRELQSELFLEQLFSTMSTKGCPILIKLDPDLPSERLHALAASAVQFGAAGVVATNTTVDDSSLVGARPQGGVSGGALKTRSRAVLAQLSDLHRSATLISVGGIDGAQEAWERLRLGAHLMEIYTAWVYSGPAFVPRLLDGLLERLDEAGLPDLDSVVHHREGAGSAAREATVENTVENRR